MATATAVLDSDVMRLEKSAVLHVIREEPNFADKIIVNKSLLNVILLDQSDFYRPD